MTIVQNEDETSGATESKETTNPQNSISTKKGPAGRKKIGSISNLNDLIANAEKTQIQRKEMKTKWDIKTILEIWNKYAAQVDTASTKNALLSAMINLRGENEIVVISPNKINTETIKKEMPLIEEIRNSYPDRTLNFTIYEDIEQFPHLTKPEPLKKAKTNQEKLDILVVKNPLVAEFIDRFKLKVDK